MSERNPAEISSVQESLSRMDHFVEDYRDDFKTEITVLFSCLAQESKDLGQQVAELVIAKSFEAMGKVSIGGADVIAGLLGGMFQVAANADGRDGVLPSYANMLERFVANIVQLRRKIAIYHDHTADHWDDDIVDPVSGKARPVSSLVSHPFPKHATEAYLELMSAALESGTYQLWRQTLRRYYERWAYYPRRPDRYFDGEKECSNWARKWVERYPYGYIRMEHVPDSRKGKWHATKFWLAHDQIIGSKKPSKALSTKLFRDGGDGITQRPGAVARRADVFENWEFKQSHQERGISTV